MLSSFPSVRHVYLASGSCLPLRPVEELVEYLDARPRTDFVESVATEYVLWTIGGLDEERFTMRFPFSWKRRRRMFDAYVSLQRRIRFRRKIPVRLAAEKMSDLDTMITDAWRWHQSRRSDCFVARKIWPDADRLYDAFLTEKRFNLAPTEPNPGKIDRVFAKAVERRTQGRPGLYMQSRFPRDGYENGKTCTAYSVFEGFSELFSDFDHWLRRNIDGSIHGHLGPDRVEFADGACSPGQPTMRLRDYAPINFLTNLLECARAAVPVRPTRQPGHKLADRYRPQR